MKKTALLICLISIVITIAIMIDFFLSPSGYLFVLWSISPFALMYVLIRFATSRAAIIGVLALSAIVSIAGFAFVFYATTVETDAQGALVYVVVPLLQWIVLLVLTLPILLLNKVKDPESGAQIAE